MPYVYSTLTGDQEYALYPPPKDIDFKGIPKPLKTVVVYGGSNVINKNMVTPRGVVTHVTDEQLKTLEQIKAFQKHRTRNFISVDKSKHDPEKVAKDMQPRDSSAQLEEKDFDPDKKPVVNVDG